MSSRLDRNVVHEFMDLPQSGRVCAEYIWVGGTGKDLRCKTKMLEKAPDSVKDLPLWNYDGSSTKQAPGHDSEVILKPVAMYRDPFRRGANILVLCSTWRADEEGELTALVVEKDLAKVGGVSGNNTRADALKVFEHKNVATQEMWFGLEQEYTLFQEDGTTPLGWPKNGFPAPQGQYYCSVGAENAFGREISDCHLRACVYAGIRVSGTNAEVMPGQWEYQVGPVQGIDAGDQLLVSRFILMRVCEMFNVVLNIEPKPVPGDWNGAGCHCNFSTKDFRDKDLEYDYEPYSGPFTGQKLKGAFAKMIEALDKMGDKAKEHIAVYGSDNDRRLTGKHETQSMDSWSYGVADRGASCRIPRETFHKKYGYLEDRRPASNMDPYVVTSMIAKTILL